MAEELKKLMDAWSKPLRDGVIPILADDKEMPPLASKESKFPPPMRRNAEIIEFQIHELSPEKQKTLRKFIERLIAFATNRDNDEH
jgi:hypothetical protein